MFNGCFVPDKYLADALRFICHFQDSGQHNSLQVLRLSKDMLASILNLFAKNIEPFTSECLRDY